MVPPTISSAGGRSTGVRDGGAQGPPSLLASKLALPVLRHADVTRVGLIERLLAAQDAQLVTIVAPAGYGKTTILRQWADREPLAAFVHLDPSDNDPTVLLEYIAAALDRVEALQPGLASIMASSGSVLLPRLMEAMWRLSGPVVLMLDDVHVIDRPACLDALSLIATHLPPNMRMVVSSRRAPDLPLARFRAEESILEIGPGDLAFDEGTAMAMARSHGVELSEDQVRSLVAQTEGWPAALYLAVRSLRTRPPDTGAPVTFPGTHAAIAEYMREELIGSLEVDEQRWLTRSSVLDEMNGPLCDVALDTTGSLGTLRKLERSNLFLMPLDEAHTSFRHHNLLRDLLRDELSVRDPTAAHGIAARAAGWCAQNGQMEAAVGYAHASGDLDQVARLVGAFALPMHWRGRTDTVGHWLEWLDTDEARGRYPSVAVLAGWVNAMQGRTREAERWLAIAEGSTDRHPMPDGTPDKEPWVALLRGMMAPSGVAAMQADARTALDGLGEQSPFRQGALILSAIAERLAGAPDAADATFAQAAELSEARAAQPGLVLAVGQRAAIALARGDIAAARRLVERGEEVVAQAALENHAEAGLLYAIAARVSLADDWPDMARRHISAVNRLRPQATDAFPWNAVQMRLEAARACLVLGEVAAARTLMLEIGEVLRDRPDLGVLVQDVADQQRAMDSMHGSASGAWTLTVAELRLLAYLPTHLTFHEIADRMFLSPFTVKTQAVSIYAKFGVSARRRAIERAVDEGLLDPAVLRLPMGLSAVKGRPSRRRRVPAA